MAQVVNTYGTKKKKKRRGIPKYIFQDGPEIDDVFEALNIENIKETKASLDEKAKKKPKRKVIIQKPALRLGTCEDANTTFDRLVKEGPVNTHAPINDSSDSSAGRVDLDLSSSPDFMNSRQKAANLERMRRKLSHVNVIPKRKFKKSDDTENIFFSKDMEESNHDENLCKYSKGSCSDSKGSPKAKLSVPVLQNQQRCLSPILPLNSTSTPVGKIRSQNFVFPSEFGTLKCDDHSVDLFSSFEFQENDHLQQLNNGAASLDMFSSCEKADSTHSFVSKPICPDSFFQCSFGIAQTSSVCEIVESNYDNNVLHLSKRMEDSCIVVHDSCGSVDIHGGCDATSLVPRHLERDKLEAAVYCPSASQDELALPFVHDSSQGADISHLDSSTSSFATQNEDDVKECRVVLTRCDIREEHAARDCNSLVLTSSETEVNSDRCGEPSLQDDKDELDDLAVSLQKIELLSATQEESPAGYKTGSEGDVPTSTSVPSAPCLLDCRVVLQRCDTEGEPPHGKSANPSFNLSGFSDLANSRELLNPCNGEHKDFEPKGAVKCLQVVDQECSVSLSEPENEMSECSGVRLSQNFRQSTVPETVVLKPGKHWRRSLSILSKVRLSSGDSSAVAKRSMTLDDAKPKGKLWESTVNSLIQLQPEVIFEDVESSFGSMSLDDTSIREKALHLSQNKSVEVLEVSLRTSGISSSEAVLRRCGQEEPISFTECYPQSMKKNCRKIGEGVYGEVFLQSKSGKPITVIKIIPIEGSMEVNGEPQKTFGEIFSEICVAQELSNLRTGTENVASTFNQVQAIRCVQGCYPAWLQELWHDYNDTKGSENDCPDMFLEDQLYIVLELSHGGEDLESFIFSSADQGLAAFKQIALSMAVGEKALSFEHRDLHWGNVLISNTKRKDIKFTLNGETKSTPSKGIEVSIIDFTLSRINDPLTGVAIFYDLSKDDTLFTAQGDYQFEIYRMMKEYCGNKWDVHTPRTNIAWLHYLLDKFCTMARYRNRTSKAHSHALDKLSEIRDTVLMFNTVSSFVQSAFFRK